MRVGIREKLFVVSLALILLVGLAAGGYLEHRLRTWIEERLESTLLSYARTARAFIERTQERSIAVMDPIADELGKAMASRVTIIAGDGRVLGDSNLSPAEVGRVENHGSRPEVLAALAQGQGMARRFSTTVGKRMLYVAVPYGQGSDRGIARISTPLAEVERVIHDLRVHLVLAGLLGLMVAVLMSGLASHLMTRTLRTLVRHARAISGAAPPETAQDEIAGLAGSFQQLVAELSRQMETLATERNRSAATLECMTDALFALDAEGRVTVVNPAALKLLRLDGAPLGEPFGTLVGVSSLAEVVARAMAGQGCSVEFELAPPGGRTILAQAAPQEAGGCVLVMHDITEIRNVERVLREFIANASHELRTPVTVIRANAETLLEGALHDPEGARHLVEALHRHAERLSRLVSDLLDLSRLDGRRFRSHSVPLSVDRVLARALDAIGATAKEKGIEICIRLRPGVRVFADTKALEQVLTNLLENAVKFTPPGGHVQVCDYPQGQGVRIEVQDDGPGVPPAHRARLFERFYRVDLGRSRDLGGTGLGLAIVKELVQSMSGSTGMRPREPRGSIFWIWLPAEPISEPAMEENEEIGDETSDPAAPRRLQAPH